MSARSLKHAWFPLALFAGVSLGANGGCTSELPSQPDPLLGGDQDASRDVFDEREFAQDTRLRARLSSSVILHLERKELGGEPSNADPNDTCGSGCDEFSYALAVPETINLCMPDAEGITGVTLSDSSGHDVLALTPGAACASTALEIGDYRVRVTRDPADQDPRPKLLFFHAAPPRAVQCSAEQLGVPDLGAHPDNSYWLASSVGLLEASLPNLLTVATSPDVFSRETTLRIKRSGHPGGFLFTSDTGETLIYRPESLKFVSAELNILWAFRATPVPDSRWAFQFEDYFPGRKWGVRSGTQVRAVVEDVPGTPGFSAVRSYVVLRYARDASQVGALAAGEVALFSGCDGTGEAWIINDGNPKLTPTDLPRAFKKPIRSIRPGCDTTLFAYDKVDNVGTPTRVSNDMNVSNDCRADRPRLSFELRSADVRVATRQLLIETNTCTNCNLRRANLTGLNLSGARLQDGTLADATLDGADLRDVKFVDIDLSGASFATGPLGPTHLELASMRSTRVDLSRMKATGAIFTDALMTGFTASFVDFTGADLSRASLDGSTLDNATMALATFDRTQFGSAILRQVDFSDSDLRTATFNETPGLALGANETLVPNPCEVQAQALSLSTFVRTRFKATQFPPTSWRKMNLTRAKIDFGGASLEGKELCGLQLGGVRFDGVGLAGAKFDRSIMEGTIFVADLTGASFRYGAISGASFAFSDLSDVVLDYAVADTQGVQATVFDRSNFAPKSIVGAHLSRATFTNAKVTIPQAHTNAQLIDAKFINADLSDSDLQDLEMQGGQFNNANFSYVHLERVKMGKSTTSLTVLDTTLFCGAYVEGADFSDANLSYARLPTTATTADSANGDGPVFCGAVKLGGTKTTLEASVKSTTNATCPNSRRTGTGCIGTDWIPSTNPPTPPPQICPPQVFGGPKRLRACLACTQNCECALEHCIAGKCEECPLPPPP